MGLKTMRITLSTITLGVLLASGVAFAGTPRVTVEQAVKDAGVVRHGETVTYDYTLHNLGDSPLQIVEVQPNCGCTVARFDHQIEPGSSGRVEVLMDTSSLEGPVAKSVKVLTNDASNPILILSAKADIRRLVDARPDYIRFRHVHGEPAENRVVTVFAPEDSDFKVTAVRSPYPFLRASVREAAPKERLEGISGAQWRVEFTLASDAPVGGLGDHVEIETNDPQQPRLELPVAGDVRPLLVATPAILETGDTGVGEHRTWVLKIQNLGQTPIQLTGVNSSMSNFVASLDESEPGSQWNLKLEFDPEGLRGAFTAKLTVRSDSAVQPELVIPIRGQVK